MMSKRITLENYHKFIHKLTNDGAFISQIVEVNEAYRFQFSWNAKIGFFIVYRNPNGNQIDTFFKFGKMDERIRLPKNMVCNFSEIFRTIDSLIELNENYYDKKN